MTHRYPPDALQSFTTDLFTRAGLPDDRATALSRTFVEADLLGFTTHGLQRVPINLQWLQDGETRATGEPKVLKDRPAVFSWDADFLPGPWVVHRAVSEAAERALDGGIAAATLQRCTHVACLAAYLIPLLDRELVGLITVSTPDERFISPFGAREAVFSNNPLAFCAPTSGVPLLFDVSMAITAGGQIARAEQQGRRLPEACLKTPDGKATDDPAVMSAEPPGTVMPIGGLGHGHKGYALTLLTEVLSQALGGHGRRDAAGEGEANSVFIEVMDPRAFSAWPDYLAEVDYLAQACREAAPDDPVNPVRLPGERAWQRRRDALAHGVTLYPGVMDAILPWAQQLGVEPPQPLG